MATPPDFSAGAVLTAAQMDKIAMWTVYPQTSFSAVSTITRDNVFTDDYLNYMIDLDFTKSTSLTVNLQERVGGVTAATAYYMAGLASEYTANTTLYFPRSNNATAAGITLAGGSGGTFVRLVMFAPKTTYKTGYAGMHVDDSGYCYHIGGLHAVATAYDGFTLTTSTGTITGKYTIYGFNEL